MAASLARLGPRNVRLLLGRVPVRPAEARRRLRHSLLPEIVAALNIADN